ncbi:MAG: hypothetical protein ACI9DJ_000805 [Algoriphagus sp.]
MKKDIEIFMQEGFVSLDNICDNWYLSNLQMESALKLKDCKGKTEWGIGGYTSDPSGSILPMYLK